MPAASKTVSASELKTHCFSLLDEVAETHLTLVVTKRGVAVAQLVPLANEPRPDLLGSVSYTSEADLLLPVGDAWEAERGGSATRGGW